MTIPVHSNQIDEERQAVAPYNFVPLPSAVRLMDDPPSQGYYQENLLSGKISCTLKNATPMYVRAAQTLAEFTEEKPSSEPFYYGASGKNKESLLIPGSSLRGMLRTLVEVVSYSRISPVFNKQLFYRSVENTSMGDVYRERMKDKVRAGFFHRKQSEMWITPTVAARVTRNDIRREFNVKDVYEEFDDKHNRIKPSAPNRVPKKNLQHKTVFVTLKDDAYDEPERFFNVLEFARKQTGDLEEAVLVITGDMKVRPAKDGTKKEKKEFVFLQTDSDVRISVTDEQIELFEDKDQVTQYQKYAFNGDGKLKDGDPVFYLVGDQESQVIGFGRAYMFRLPYKFSPLEMLPGEITKLPEKYDLAEALFGYVPQDKKGRKQVASRLRISDAFFQGDFQNALLDEMHLKVLSSPKPTTFQHYLTQGKPNNPDRLSHYDSPRGSTTLRGHKFYWHKGDVSLNDYKAPDNDYDEHKSQYSPAVKPIREDQTFNFDIAFENLRPEELGALLWVLDKAGDPDYRLKIGMGKPYGLGSVSIESEINFENRMLRYQKLFTEKKWQSVLETSKEKENNARSAFARWLFGTQDAAIDQVDQLSRIQELLVMLSWTEHPLPKKTRYMEVDEFAGRKHMITGESGYFPKRPVLPLPRQVFGVWSKGSTSVSEIKPIAPVEEPRIARNRVKPTPTTVSPSELKIGDAILARVIKVIKQGDVTLHCESHEKDDVCVIPIQYRSSADRYKEGNSVLLIVTKTVKTPNGWVVECEKHS